MKLTVINSKYFLISVLVVFNLILINCQPKAQTIPMNNQQILTFHHSILTLDSHVDTPLRIKYEGIKLGQKYDPHEIKSKLDLPRMQEGGLDAAFFAVWTAQGVRSDNAHAAVKQKALSIIDQVEGELQQYPEQIKLATHSSEASKLASENKHAIYLGMENGYPIGNDIDNVNLFFDRGIRYITLCHTSNNDICDSSNDTTEYGGLSPFGFTVVERMNQLGLMVDISHVSNATVEDVLATSKTPVIASHSCSQAMCDNPRNINDSLLAKIAEKGGVVQMCLYSEYILPDLPNPDRDSARAALKEKWGDPYKLQGEKKLQYRTEKNAMDRKHPQILPSVADAVDHIDHMVEVMGIDHVGIGTDFDGGAALSDCYDVSQLPNITLELFKRGYSEADIQKIWSGNFLRVFSAVEQYAQSQN